MTPMPGTCGCLACGRLVSVAEVEGLAGEEVDCGDVGFDFGGYVLAVD